MGKLKLKNRIAIALTGIVLCLILFFIFFYDNDKYIYQNELTQILGIEQVEVKGKSITESWAVGEWYICETYDLTQENFNAFLAGNKRNKLYSADNFGVTKDWGKLPVDSQYNEIKDMVINYMATRKIEQRTNEMQQIISARSGYYSFLCQPNIETPQKVLFFLLDEKTKRLFVVDLKL